MIERSGISDWRRVKGIEQGRRGVLGGFRICFVRIFGSFCSRVVVVSIVTLRSALQCASSFVRVLSRYRESNNENLRKKSTLLPTIHSQPRTSVQTPRRRSEGYIQPTAQDTRRFNRILASQSRPLGFIKLYLSSLLHNIEQRRDSLEGIHKDYRKLESPHSKLGQLCSLILPP